MIFTVAIDGPAAAGKGTISKAVPSVISSSTGPSVTFEVPIRPSGSSVTSCNAQCS